MNIIDVYTPNKLRTYLQARWLIKQYDKQVAAILAWRYKDVKLEYRRPKKAGVLYFRINQQFRANGRIKDWILIIHSIDNHQN